MLQTISRVCAMSARLHRETIIIVLKLGSSRKARKPSEIFFSSVPNAQAPDAINAHRYRLWRDTDNHPAPFVRRGYGLRYFVADALL